MSRMVCVLTFLCICLLVGCKGKTKEELFSEGMKEKNKGNHNGAIVLFKNALEKDPGYREARLNLAKELLTIGRLELAEREFRNIQKSNPGGEDVQLDLARIHIMTKRADEGISEATDFLKRHQGNAEALEILGIGYLAKKDTREGERFLLESIKADPARFSAKLELAAYYSAQKQPDRARSLAQEVLGKDPNNIQALYFLASLEESSGNKPRALELYSRIASVDPQQVAALYKVGLIHLDDGDMAKAEQVAADILKRFPKRSEGTRLRGLINFRKKAFSEAITDLQSSLKVQQSLQALYYLGLSCYNMGDYETSLSYFRKAIQIDPSYLQARLISAAVLLKKARSDEAISEIEKVIEVDPNNALAHNVLGSAYLSKGMYQEGMKELSRAIALDPKITDAYVKKGVLHLRMGMDREAESDLQAAVKVSPEILNTRLLLAAYYVQKNDFAGATKVLAAGLSGGKTDAPIYNSMGVLAAMSGKNPADALKYLQKSKETDPDFFPPYFTLASIYSATGERDKAAAEYRLVLAKDPKNIKALLGLANIAELTGKDNDALSFYKQAKDTKNPAAFLSLAGYYTRKGDASKAVSVLDEAISSIPKNTAALEMKGKILLHEKKYDDALKAFSDLNDISPDRGTSLQLQCYLVMNDIPKAVQLAERVIRMKPTSPEGHLMLASVYEHKKEYPRAIASLQEAMRCDGRNLQIQVTLGNLYAKSKDYPNAAKMYAGVLKHDPNFVPALFAQGVLAQETGKVKEAIAKYRVILLKTDSYVPALNNLAYLYLNGWGSVEEGLRLASSAYRLDPGNPRIAETLGYALYRNNRGEDARKFLEGVSKALPDEPVVYYHLGLLYRDAGRKDDAVKAMTKALSLGEFDERAEAVKALRNLGR